MSMTKLDISLPFKIPEIHEILPKFWRNLNPWLYLPIIRRMHNGDSLGSGALHTAAGGKMLTE